MRFTPTIKNLFKSRSPGRLSLLLILSVAGLIVLSGCGFPVVVVVTATPTDIVTAGPTALPPSTVEPATATPTSLPPVEPGTSQQIEFAPGQTSIQIAAQVGTGQTDEYILRAL